MGILGRVRAFDAFPKTMEDFREKTTSGGVVSIISMLLIAVLVIYETGSYLTPKRSVDLTVDVSRGEKLKIYVDIDFPELNCDILGIDAIDVAGKAQLEITNHIYKEKLGRDGKPLSPGSKKDRAFLTRHVKNTSLPDDYCGSCYGAEKTPGKCCNTCDDVKNAYGKAGWVITDFSNIEQCVREDVVEIMNQKDKLIPGEGCNIHGFVEVSKVQGNFHICPGHSFEWGGRAIHDMSVFRGQILNLSHVIRRFSFGDDYPGKQNPLDGLKKIAGEKFVKICPPSDTGKRLTKR